MSGSTLDHNLGWLARGLADQDLGTTIGVGPRHLGCAQWGLVAIVGAGRHSIRGLLAAAVAGLTGDHGTHGGPHGWSLSSLLRFFL